jgi:hypothetical protein
MCRAGVLILRLCRAVLLRQPRLPGQRAAGMAGAQVTASVQGAQRSGCGHADEGYPAAGGGFTGSGDDRQGQDLRSAEVLGAAGRSCFDQIDQAVGDLARIDRLEGQVPGNREQAVAEHPVDQGMELGSPLNGPAAAGLHDLLGPPFGPVVAGAELIDAHDRGIHQVRPGRLRGA